MITFAYRILFLLFLLLAANFSLEAQQIRADVSVDRSRIDNASLSYLDGFSQELESYLNNTTWTNDRFDPYEKIEVSIQVNLVGVSDDFQFDADIIIQSRRPIYNSTRYTTVFLYNDQNWTFQYLPNRGLVHDELQFDPLTTLLDFYAYIIMGYDYDTFAALGGTPYFSEAQNLVSRAQRTAAAGWLRNSSVPRNRAQLLADLLTPSYEPFRRAMYVYHREGLDTFLDDPNQARARVFEALEMIRAAREQTTNNLLFNTFFNTKYRELVSIFEDASSPMRLAVYELLADMDPSHLGTYDKLR